MSVLDVLFLAIVGGGLLVLSAGLAAEGTWGGAAFTFITAVGVVLYGLSGS